MFSEINYIASTHKDYINKYISKYVKSVDLEKISQIKNFTIYLLNNIDGKFGKMEIDLKVLVKKSNISKIESIINKSENCYLTPINEFSYKLEVDFISSNSYHRTTLVKDILQVLLTEDFKIQNFNLTLSNDTNILFTNNLASFLTNETKSYTVLFDTTSYNQNQIEDIVTLLIISSGKYNIHFYNNSEKENDLWEIAIKDEFNRRHCNNLKFLLKSFISQNDSFNSLKF